MQESAAVIRGATPRAVIVNRQSARQASTPPGKRATWGMGCKRTEWQMRCAMTLCAVDNQAKPAHVQAKEGGLPLCPRDQLGLVRARAVVRCGGSMRRASAQSHGSALRNVVFASDVRRFLYVPSRRHGMAFTGRRVPELVFLHACRISTSTLLSLT